RRRAALAAQGDHLEQVVDFWLVHVIDLEEAPDLGRRHAGSLERGAERELAIQRGVEGGGDPAVRLFAVALRQQLAALLDAGLQPGQVLDEEVAGRRIGQGRGRRGGREAGTRHRRDREAGLRGRRRHVGGDESLQKLEHVVRLLPLVVREVAADQAPAPVGRVRGHPPVVAGLYRGQDGGRVGVVHLLDGLLLIRHEGGQPVGVRRSEGGPREVGPAGPGGQVALRRRVEPLLGQQAVELPEQRQLLRQQYGGELAVGRPFTAGAAVHRRRLGEAGQQRVERARGGGEVGDLEIEEALAQLARRQRRPRGEELGGGHLVEHVE